MCKHYNTPQGCSYGDKCQFAHGAQELRLNTSGIMSQQNKNKTNNMLNYKIVKCKNWEKDKSCKYGAHCTFAHGEEELRNKADNLYQMAPSNVGMVFPAFMMDMSQMQQMQQMMPAQFDMRQMNMAPMMMGMNDGNVMQPMNAEKNE